MAETMEVSLETLAGIAGGGGADPDLDEVIYTPASDVDTGGLHILGEGINAIPSE